MIIPLGVFRGLFNKLNFLDTLLAGGLISLLRGANIEDDNEVGKLRRKGSMRQ
jgi:hypothetical protein